MKILMKKKDGSQTYIDAKNLEIAGETLKERFERLHQDIEAHQKAFAEICANIEGKILLPADKAVIMEIGGQLMRGTVENVAADNGEKLSIHKFENGKLVKDKKKVGKVL